MQSDIWAILSLKMTVWDAQHREFFRGSSNFTFYRFFHELSHFESTNDFFFDISAKKWLSVGWLTLGEVEDLQISRTWKRIFRRFRISNQIFDSICRSRDIWLSLDPIFAFFGPNLTFRDEYLENEFFFDKRFSQAER